MIAPALAALHALPAAIDQTDGSAFGMKKAMLIMAGVALVILVAAVVIGNAWARRHPPKEPTYPILEPPGGRDAGRPHGR